jgi:hypothetical protein
VISIERSTAARSGAVVIAAIAGVAVAISPVPAVIATVVIVGAVWLFGRGAGVTRVFLASLAIIILGYAFFNRAFAYVGYTPVFVGEVVLGLGILALIYSIRRWRLTPVTFIILVFMVWGALQTIPYLSQYGVDALRDAVAWIYAAFALILVTVLRPEQMTTVVRLVRRVIPYLLVWLPISLFVAKFFESSVPTIPGSTVPLLNSKGGDVGVLLAGIAAFILVGLYARAEPRPRFPEPLPWVPWLIGAGVVSIVNRGGLVAISMTALVLIFIRQSGRWLSLVFVISLVLVLGVLFDPRLDFGGKRELSFRQLTDNVASIFLPSNDALQGTRDFRLAWWSKIVDYTVDGPYFWTGKGYGIALAPADGFNTTEAELLRSPHNGHIEFLARSGVPGLLLWVLLQGAFAITMIRAANRARADGRIFWVQVIGWLFVAWAAGLANATFDPYLQGPQGGILFWSTMGLGLVAIRAVHEGVPDPWAEEATPVPAAPPKALPRPATP